MKKQKKFLINRTLNELLLKVISGVNYASKIAFETGKSIPVVYRQLDSLVGFGILDKKRSGKKVVYEINWMNLSDIISSTLSFDIEKIREITKAEEKETELIKEINHLVTGIPPEFFNDEKKINNLVKEFLEKPSVLILLEKFFTDIEKTGEEMIEYNKIAFNKSIDLFFDSFGMLTDEERKDFVDEKINSDKDDIKNFLKYCRLRYLQKKLKDPRNKLVRNLVEK
ncbi:hypothetical protein GF327_02705 [Candidatus Woesearchaeota archaeon]|nr:hypothetical protein [Candidatus Woesearchaeota archaeon]